MPLQPLGKRCKQDSGEGYDDHADKERVGSERLSAVGNQEPNTFASAKHLANDNADQSKRDSLTHAGQDERHRARNREGLENLPIRCTKCTRSSKQVRVHVPDPPNCIHENGKER